LDESRGWLQTANKLQRAETERYRRERLKQLRQATAEATRQVASQEAELERARQSSERLTDLVSAGVATRQEVEAGARDRAVAGEQLAASQDRLEALRRAVEALESGVDIGVLEGSTTPPTSQSAVRETSLRLLDVDIDAAKARASREAVHAQLQAEAQRVERLRSQRVVLDHPGRVVTLSAANGEYVTRGQELMKIADCANYVVLAYVSEAVFSRLTTGARAELKIFGSKGRLQGKVLQLLGPYSEQGRTLPVLEGRLYEGPDRFQVLLKFPDLANRYAPSCTSGMPGEVYFPDAIWQPHW
jgi:multidrug resistance efflux pump